MNIARSKLAALTAVPFLLMLAGCGGDDGSSGASTASSPSGAVLAGGGLTVAEAIATDAEPPLAVGGWVVGTGADTRLCSGYEAGEGEPCLEPSLALRGPGDVVSGTKVSLLGAVENGAFVVSSAVQK